MDKLLVIRFSSLGDIILLTAFFRELRRKFPSAQIDFLTSTTFAEVVENNPNINRVIQLDRSKGPGELNEIVEFCKNQQYSYVFDAHRSLRSRLVIFRLFGIGSFFKSNIFRINKRTFNRNLLLLFKINRFDKIVSQREAYCQLLNHLFPLYEIDSKTELFPSPLNNKKISKILAKNNYLAGEYVVIGPGASFPGKCWPKEHFLEVIKTLRKKNEKIVLLGGPQESEIQWISSQIDDKKVINLSGQLSYLESAALLQQAKYAISNDSAILHFSEAVETPVFSIFGPTTQEFGYAPFLQSSQIVEINLPCRPCSRNGKGKCKNKIERQCLRDIKPNYLLELIEKKFKK